MAAKTDVGEDRGRIYADVANGAILSEPAAGPSALNTEEHRE